MAATTKKICELPADIADVVLANHPVVVDRSMGVLQQMALVPALAHKHVVSANCSPSRHEFEEHPLRPYCLWEAESVVHKFNASRLPASALLVHPLRDTLFAQQSIAHWRVACESILLAGYNVAPSTEVVAWLSEPDFVRYDERPSIADTIANVRVASQLTVYDCHSDLRHHICSSDKLAAIRSMTGLRSLMLHGCSHGITMVEAFGVVEVMPWLVFLRCAVNGAIVMKIHTSSPAPCIPRNAVVLQKTTKLRVNTMHVVQQNALVKIALRFAASPIVIGGLKHRTRKTRLRHLRPHLHLSALGSWSICT